MAIILSNKVYLLVVWVITYVNAIMLYYIGLWHPYNYSLLDDIYSFMKVKPSTWI